MCRCQIKKNCLNVGKYNSECVYMGHFQAGGGTASPEYSYIFCELLDVRVRVEPTLAKYESEVERVLVPDNCTICKPPQMSIFDIGD